MLVGKGRNLLVRSNGFCFAALLATLSISAPAYCQAVREPQSSKVIDIPALIRESGQNRRRMYFRFRDYTYKVHQIRRERSKNGEVKEESEVAEMTFPNIKGIYKKPVYSWIIVEKNGKPTSPERLAKERVKLGKRLEKAGRQVEEGGLETLQGQSLYWHICSKEHRCMRFYESEVLEKCDFFSPQHEQIGGREMIALDFRPRLDATFTEESKYMPHVEGKIWVDASDKVIARLAVWPKGTKFEDTSSDYLLKNAAIALDWLRTKEGAWLYRYTRINALKYPELLLGIGVDHTSECFDHAYFKVEVGKEQIKAPEPQR